MRDLRFHQGFALNRDRLSALIRCIAESKGNSTAEIAAYIGVNKPVVEGLRGWLSKTGLGQVTAQTTLLTKLGSIIARHDPHLRDSNTLWLLHYFLVSQHEERAEVWYRCFNEFLSPGKTFSANELRMHIEQRLEATPSNRDGVKNDTSALINCYTHLDNLGTLQLLVKPVRAAVAVGDVLTPDALIIGFVVFDSWQRRFGVVDSVRLSMLVDAPESIGKVFVANHTQTRKYIGQLERLGLVTFADTQYEPVTRRFFDDPLVLVSRYYQ